MASYTPNLDLLKKNPLTEGNDAFNIDTMLNDNWDKIDAGVGALEEDMPAPSSTTPAMDGTAAAGSEATYARGDHVHPRDTSKADQSVVDTLVRPNLLKNAYFVGGGSQQGGGQFPINKRGQTSYAAVGYTIDRWRLWGTDLTVSVTSAGLKLTPVSGSPRLFQYLENFEILYGQIVTVSALIGSELVTASGTFSSSAWIAGQFTNGYLQFVCENNGAAAYVSFEVSSEVVVKAVKLELGDTQTLAHQENGEWVLNEIPDYNEELVRCMDTPSQIETGSYVGTGTSGSANANSLTFGFKPKIVLIQGGSTFLSFAIDSLLSSNFMEAGYVSMHDTYNSYARAKYSGMTLSWYSTNTNYTTQANSSSTTYWYIAIG